MTITQRINGAADQFTARWNEFQNLTTHDQKQFCVCMVLGFAFVIGILALACR